MPNNSMLRKLLIPTVLLALGAVAIKFGISQPPGEPHDLHTKASSYR